MAVKSQSAFLHHVELGDFSLSPLNTVNDGNIPSPVLVVLAKSFLRKLALILWSDRWKFIYRAISSCQTVANRAILLEQISQTMLMHAHFEIHSL